MFERFTNAARDVVVRAQAETRALGHARIGGEHLLLALSKGESESAMLLRDLGATPHRVRAAVAGLVGGSAVDEGQPDPAALESIGIDLDAVRRRIEEAFGPGALDRTRVGRARDERRGRHLPFSREAKATLERSLRESLALKHRHIGTEHLLLALTFDVRSAAGRVLGSLGLAPADVRQAVLDSLSRPANSA
jgi:ATP-dependent Clp protease ATP-binding subunit ClpA